MPWERPATRHVAAGVHGPACGALRCLAMPPTQPTRRWTPGYRRLWSATATSAVGTGMTTAAIPLVAALRPDSEFLLGAVAAAGLLPGLLLSIPAGVAADRWDRRRIMIWADLVRAVAIAAAALVLATSTLPAVALAALAFVVGAGETLFITASQSTLPSLVADDALDEANGHLQAATDGGREFVGPPIGSWLFHLVKWAPFAGDAVTYAASAAILAGVPPTADAPASPSPASPSRASPAAPDGSAGHGDGIGPAWRFLRGHRTLAVLAGALVVLSMSGAAVLALLVLVVTERWGLDDAWFGVALTLVACGATLAGMLAGAVRRLLSARATMSLARRRAVATVLKRHKMLLMEDVVHAAAMAEPLPAIASMLPEQSFLLSSFSKVLAPGLRVGYLEASAPWLDKVAASIRADCWMVAPLLPEILTRWLVSGRAGELIAHQRAAIHERLALATRCLRGLGFRSAPDLPHLYMPLPEPWTVPQFTAALRNAGVLVRTMDHFAAGRHAPPNAVRISLNAAPTLDVLRQGLQALASVRHAGVDSTTGQQPLVVG